ncbi:hypothetical protein G9A89_021456 [Geosiphon pyriformis]|nr:hypothetical protein G9A89_021456 [Geosiphon pyriformis]
MELVSLSAGESGSVLAGLGTCLNAKKNCLDTVYSYSASYKKIKKHMASIMVDLSTGPLSLEDIGNAGIKPVVFWGSKVGSIASSINNLLDVENMANMVAKETNYVKSDKDDNMDDGNLPKQFFFNYMSNDDNKLVLPPSMILRSNKLLPIESCAMDKWSFNLSKFFALDIKLLAVSGKTVGDKLICVKKIFYQTKKLAICKKIVVNDNLKKISNHSDKEIIVKKIPFGKIVSIKMQLIGLWQKALVEFESFEIADLVTAKWSVYMGKNSICVVKVALLYTLSVGITAHNLLDLLESYGGKTCFIDCNLILYARDRCAIVCFVDEASKLAAIGSTPVFKNVNLHWAGFFLVCCAHCKQFGYISTKCSLGENSGTRSKRVKKKQAPIVRPVFFGEKTWAQVTGGSFFHEVSSNFFGVGSSLGAKPVLLVSDSHELVPLASSPHVSHLVVIAPITANMNLDMILDDTIMSSLPSLSAVADSVVNLSSSSSKVLTTKVGGLESKMMALEVSVESVLERLDRLCSDMNNLVSIFIETKLKGKICPWIVNKFDGIWVFTSGLNSGHMGSKIAIAMNNSLAKHVYKVSKVSVFMLVPLHWFGSLKLNGSQKCASFKKCFNLGLMNSLNGSLTAKAPIWCNSRGVSKTIDYVFVSSNLVNAIVNCSVADVVNYFNTDHMAVSVSVGLDGLLDNGNIRKSTVWE